MSTNSKKLKKKKTTKVKIKNLFESDLITSLDVNEEQFNKSIKRYIKKLKITKYFIKSLIFKKDIWLIQDSKIKVLKATKQLDNLFKFIGDTETTTKFIKIFKCLKRLDKLLAQKNINKNKVIIRLKKLRKLYNSIKLDEKSCENLKIFFDHLKDIKPVFFKGVSNKVQTIVAPLLFILDDTVEDTEYRKFEIHLNMKRFMNYGYIEEALILIVPYSNNLESVGKGKKLYIHELQARKLCALVSTRENDPLFPFFDVSTNNKKWYLVWVLQEKNARFVDSLQKKLSKFKIMVNTE